MPGRGTSFLSRSSLYCTGVAQSLARMPPVSEEVGFRHLWGNRYF